MTDKQIQAGFTIVLLGGLLLAYILPVNIGSKIADVVFVLMLIDGIAYAVMRFRGNDKGNSNNGTPQD